MELGLVHHAWHVAEPIHGLIYYAPETREETERFHLPGRWMWYFGCRLAPLGAVSAATATAVLYHLAPAMVTRSVPALWEHASPERFLQARLSAVDRALCRMAGTALDSATVARAADLAVAAASTVEGRPLGAANAALGVPDLPHLALWQALTTLREHRGDGHVATLIAAEVGPCAANVLAAASGRAPEDDSKRYHKWSDVEWSDAEEDLHRRGWLRRDGTLTEAGAQARERIEHDTDRLARLPYATLGTARTEELVTCLRPLADTLMAAGAVPIPNPVGFSWPPSA